MSGLDIRYGVRVGPKNNQWVKVLVDGICEREKTYGNRTADMKYGPMYITEKIPMSLAGDSKYVYPYLWTEKHRKNENFEITSPKSFAVHHWNGSWT